MEEKKNEKKMNLLRDSRIIIRAFRGLRDSKRNASLFMKLTVAFCSIIVALMMFYTNRLQRDAMSRILVVDNAGELRKVRSEQEDKFYLSLLYTHCEQSGTYINTFDGGTIEEYHKKALPLCNKADLQRVWAMYDSQGAYADAVNRGVCYRYTFKDVLTARNKGGNEYEVTFWGVLEIIDGSSTKWVKITSRGTAMRVDARWPDNVTGYFWRSYSEQYSLLEDENQNS